MLANYIIALVYLITTVLLVIALKAMASPKTASQGFTFASIGMLIAVIATFFLLNFQQLSNIILIICAMIIGSAFAIYAGQRVKMIQMPQMIAFFNAMGGGAAAAIGLVELLQQTGLGVRSLSLLSVIIGSLSLSGSIIAFTKLQEWMKKPFVFPFYFAFNIILLAIIVLLSIALSFNFITNSWLPFIVIGLCCIGVIFTLPIGGANMPIVISLFNALTGIAVSCSGFVLQNPALIIAGILVGASGMLLTQLMAKAMNRSLLSILMPAKTSEKNVAQNDAQEAKPISIDDAAAELAYANSVIIVPGYGMAVAQAQHKIWELTKLLEKRGVKVKFAIHPVAGRMPGHMNVLLAEAGVPYEQIADMDEINPSFAHTDVALIIGANDVVNPAARQQADSPIYGMPILDAALAKQILVIKRGQGKGFSGVENALFLQDNVHMLYGQGAEVVNGLIQAIKNIE